MFAVCWCNWDKRLKNGCMLTALSLPLSTVPPSLTEGIEEDILDANLQLPSQRLGDLPRPPSAEEGEEQEKEEEIETIIYEELSDEDNGVSQLTVALTPLY